MSPTGGVSEGEFARALDAVRDEMRHGFGGINARLDMLNGQTRRHGESIAVLRTEDDAQDVALEGIADAVAELRTAVQDATLSATRKAIRERVPSKKTAVGLLAGAGVVVEVVWRVVAWKFGLGG